MFDILLVEADPDEIAPFIDSFETTNLTNAVTVVADADEALDYIYRQGTYSDVPRPNLILLNLHVPGGEGEDILVELNEQPSLQRVLVLVFTSSEGVEDVADRTNSMQTPICNVQIQPRRSRNLRKPSRSSG